MLLLLCVFIYQFSSLTQIYSFIHFVLHSFRPSFISSFIHLVLRSFSPSFISSFIHFALHSLIYSFNTLFIHLFLRSFIHSFIMYSFVHVFIIYSLIHLFIQLLNFIHLFQGFFLEGYITDSVIYKTKIHCISLDHARVTRLQRGEKNYDVFYQMLAGLSNEERGKKVGHLYSKTRLYVDGHLSCEQKLQLVYV